MSNNMPGFHKKIECPVSSGVLHDLYWQDRKNLREIASHLYEKGLTEHVVSWGKVRSWFAEYNVPVANPTQNFRRGLETKRKKYGSVSKILRGRTWSLSEDQKKRASTIRKGKKLGNQTLEQLGHPEIECCACASKFWRRSSEIRSAFRYGRKAVFFYCSPECRKKGPRFDNVAYAEAVYFNTEWYAEALKKSGVAA